ncbi:TonB-dependent receptor domain-containing protein [Ideonella sp.]|uniref:TonB-dependent receptor domain-containing protein n=1 Tax=Ideonella sp. TaxID=1929293 RepID=UPI0035B14AEF
MRPAHRQARPTLHLLAQVALLALAAPLAANGQTPAADDTGTTPKPARVEITGSLIKRIEGESALPIQVITREEINKLGITTAAELMGKLTAASNGLTDGGSINVGGYDQKGFNSANLRGVGTSSTLVLLNGRRMANFASPGDDAGVDLNNIPAAAIQRVEVLLDGASARYGTDAIGGVINFITQTDYQGVELNAYGGGTQEGGGGKTTASIAAGFGSLGESGFNVFGVLDVQHTQALRTSQRDFIKDLRVPERLPHLLSGYTSPANIRLGSDQRDYLQEHNFELAPGHPIENRTINLSVPNCNPPANLYLPNGIGGVDACTYDYMRDTELYPKSDKLGFLGRGVLALGGEHQLYGEVAYSRAKTWYVGSSARTNSVMQVKDVPEFVAIGMDQDPDVDQELEVHARLPEAGARTSELTSTGERYVVGLSGVLSGWDYDIGLNHSVNTVADKDGHGYLLYQELQDAIYDHVVDVVHPDPATNKAFYDTIQVNDVARRSKGTMDSIDAKASRSLMKLDGGDLALGLGGEFRRETTSYKPSALYASDNINNDDVAGETEPRSDSRKVAAVYAELEAPISKQWTLQFAARHDKYQNVGSTTNPKIGAKFQPMPELLLRGSAGTGFRAPSLSDLYRPTVVSSTATLPDPVCMAENDNDLSFCADNWETHRFSNANLKPEHSRQFSLGVVAQPSKNWSFSVDYWNIRKSDLISELGDDVILSHADKYASLIHRYSDPRNGNQDFIDTCGEDPDPDDTGICYIDLRKENRGAMRSSGLDIVVDWSGLKTAFGEFAVHLAGTYTLESKQQTGDGDPFVSNLGHFVTDGVVQRWRHRLSADWEYGAFGATLSNTYYSGYEDQNSAIDTDSGTVVGKNHVKAYSLWDLSGSWAFDKSLKFRAGVRNVFDTPPPYSNQAWYFISGYDPSYTDPRGRFFYASVQYTFK